MSAVLLVVPSWEPSEASLVVRAELEHAGLSVVTVDETIVGRVNPQSFEAVIVLDGSTDAYEARQLARRISEQIERRDQLYAEMMA